MAIMQYIVFIELIYSIAPAVYYYFIIPGANVMVHNRNGPAVACDSNVFGLLQDY
jgi:hypothetical protein